MDKPAKIPAWCMLLIVALFCAPSNRVIADGDDLWELSLNTLFLDPLGGGIEEMRIRFGADTYDDIFVLGKGLELAADYHFPLGASDRFSIGPYGSLSYIVFDGQRISLGNNTVEVQDLRLYQLLGGIHAQRVFPRADMESFWRVGTMLGAGVSLNGKVQYTLDEADVDTDERVAIIKADSTFVTDVKFFGGYVSEKGLGTQLFFGYRSHGTPRIKDDADRNAFLQTFTFGFEISKFF